MIRFSRSKLLGTLTILAIGASASWYVRPLADGSTVFESTTDNSVTTGDDQTAEALYATISHLIGRQTYLSLPPAQQRLLVGAYERGLAKQVAPFACFTPDTPNEVIQAFDIALGAGPRAQLTGRWSSTATNGAGLTQGTPTALTFGFVPDGTFVPNLIGVTGNSNLHAWLDGIYGNQATWQPLFEQMFARWSELASLTYVYEPNDDGSNLNGAAGVLGVRADLRIAAITIDGNSGTLAYNNFPNDGDMVLDSADNFFNNTTSNSLRLRNTIAHEHGHGMGLLHVCPINQTKLMEPFISLAYDGPQHDDIRGAQRHYGDPSENDNSSGAATDIGVLNSGSSIDVGAISPPTNGSVLSIDANGESDWFRFTTSTSVSVTATATPVGLSYDDSAQSGSCGGAGNCCSGNIINSASIADLNVEIIDTNGATVLATGSSQPIGSAETTNQAALINPGNYFVRVFEGNAPSQAQLYRLTVTAAPLPPLLISLPDGPPAELIPGMVTNFSVSIIDGSETLVPGSGTLHYRYDGGTFLTAALAPAGGNLFTASLPAADCGDNPEFYVTADGNLGGMVAEPDNAPASVFTAPVGETFTFFADDFESNLGWTVSGTAPDGQWDRGVPVGGCDRGNPDFDFDGSGSCYLTDNSAANACNSDVDDGTTILTSPVMDASTGGNLSYAYWLNDVPNGLLTAEDDLVVELATNAGGTNWTEVRRYETALGAWRTDTIDVASEVGATATLRVRFIAQDLGTQNVVECGVDAVSLTNFECIAVPLDCDTILNADMNFDTFVDGLDIQRFVDILTGVGPPPTDEENCAGDVGAVPDDVIGEDDLSNIADCVLSGGCP
ncbi:MAG: matrixin family metalloprotease [Planctomycetia bacterium]|nr:matrixin family metalloprotease [Planctomycetia bacterium]MCC7316523.1 zinc-dependent metalloprotease [Planctomycetota bacterium]